MEPPVEAIIEAYVEASNGDLRESLRLAVSDALADLTEAERRARTAVRLISRGYARGQTVSGTSASRLLQGISLDTNPTSGTSAASPTTD